MTKPYDKNKVGKFIGWGGEHLVYAYGDDRVIKFSLHVWLSGKTAVEKIVADYALGKRYFDGYLLPTDVRTWRNGTRCVELQPNIQCRFFHRNDIANLLLKGQFDDIIQRCRPMER